MLYAKRRNFARSNEHRVKQLPRIIKERRNMNISPLQKARYEYAPKLPGMLRHGIADICVKEGEETQSVADQEKIKALFPNTYGKKEITFEKGQNTSDMKKQIVGVILSGGQAPGGHNVVCGLYDALKATNKENELYGFKGGPSGLIEDDYIVMTDEYINQFRNTEPSLKPTSSLQLLLRFARSMALPLSLSSVVMIPIQTLLFSQSTLQHTTPAFR